MGAAPAWMLPHTTLTPARGSIRRLSTAGSSVVTLAEREREVPGQVRPAGVAAGARTAAPRRGPRRWSAAPAAGRPGRRRRSGSQCRAKSRSTPSRAPSSTISTAPPGMTSSAGWNSSRTLPVSSPRACSSASASAAPTSAAVCTSWPHAWATPGDGARPRVVGEVLDRQRVHVGAQRDPRPAGRRVGDEPGERHPGDPPAGLLDPCGDQVGGAGLGPGQLGVRVQVPAQVDELGVVLLDDVGDQRRRTSGADRGPNLVDRATWSQALGPTAARGPPALPGAPCRSGDRRDAGPPCRRLVAPCPAAAALAGREDVAVATVSTSPGSGADAGRAWHARRLDARDPAGEELGDEMSPCSPTARPVGLTSPSRP